MVWRDWPSWLKGGVIAAGFVTALIVISYVAVRRDVVFSELVTILIYEKFFIYIIVYFVIGAIVGSIYGKSKKKNKR